MKRSALLLGVAAVLSGTVLAAQLYRWVDDKGNVEWRDTPPPSGAAAKKIEQRKVSGGSASGAEQPFVVQQAMKNFPVTVWITDCGEACAKMRAHLERRGVPHTEKDPRADFENFKKVSGGSEVPVIFIGSTRLRGYLETDLDAALDNAGYPKTALVKPQPKPPAADKGEKGASEKGAEAPAEKPAPVATGGGVKLYTAPDCGPNCANAKKLLGSRGVTFQEVAIVDPAQVDELKKLTGNDVVPVLLVGNFWLQGYSAAEYESALDKAGFRKPQPQQ